MSFLCIFGQADTKHLSSRSHCEFSGVSLDLQQIKEKSHPYPFRKRLGTHWPRCCVCACACALWPLEKSSSLPTTRTSVCWTTPWCVCWTTPWCVLDAALVRNDGRAFRTKVFEASVAGWYPQRSSSRQILNPLAT